VSIRLLSTVGVLVGFLCFGVAAAMHPGGYDLNRDYLSTLLRDASAPSRITAVVGMFVFCVSIALVFERLARSTESTGGPKVIRVAGIGSTVYAALAVTPLHDLMVMISVVFFAIAVLALLRALYLGREVGFLAAGFACFALLVASTTIYYSQHFVVVLPWAQRILFVVCAVWLVCLDLHVPGLRLGRIEPA